MATKEELLHEQTVDDLRSFAADEDVDLSGCTTKDQIVAELTSSVTRAQIEERFPSEETPEEETPEEETPEEEAEFLTPEEIAGAGGDVDIARVDPGSGKDELGPVILAGSWVRLGNHESVPDRYVGHIAAVVTSPDRPVPFATGEEDIHGYHLGDGDFTVTTRDESNVTLVVPREAFDEVADSRTVLLAIA